MGLNTMKVDFIDKIPDFINEILQNGTYKVPKIAPNIMKYCNATKKVRNRTYYRKYWLLTDATYNCITEGNTFIIQSEFCLWKMTAMSHPANFVVIANFYLTLHITFTVVNPF